MSHSNTYSFIDAKIELSDDQICFRNGLIQKLNQLLGRKNMPESIALNKISRCYIKYKPVFTHKPMLVIEHADGKEEIRCNKGIFHKGTSLIGYDGKQGAEELKQKLEKYEDEQLMKDL